MTLAPVKLHHVSRQTQCLDKTLKFYVHVLGFREISRPPFNFGGAWLYGAGIQIHLIEEPFAPQTMDLNTRENHIAFQVEDMAASEEVLKAHGVEYRHNVVPERNVNQLFFKDPDGWMIELGPFPNVMDR